MELIAKLENPGSLHPNARSYTVTSQGISLSKGEEIGMFKMGSTIVMLYEVPPNGKYDLLVKEGDSVKMGQKLTGKVQQSQ